jgi:hypothetical protein
MYRQKAQFMFEHFLLEGFCPRLAPADFQGTITSPTLLSVTSQLMVYIYIYIYISYI